MRPRERKHINWSLVPGNRPTSRFTQTRANAQGLSPVEAGGGEIGELRKKPGGIQRGAPYYLHLRVLSWEKLEDIWEICTWWAVTTFLASPKSKGLRPATTPLHLSRGSQASLQAIG